MEIFRKAFEDNLGNQMTASLYPCRCFCSIIRSKHSSKEENDEHFSDGYVQQSLVLGPFAG